MNHFKEVFFNKIFTLRRLFFVFNFLVLGLFIYALAKDSFREWKPYQKEYTRLDEERIQTLMEDGDEATRMALQQELKAVHSRPREIKQFLVPDLHAVDRCITCHVGYDSFTNPALINDYPHHPFATPKNLIHDQHPFEKYGCTICHGGQGLATTFVDAGHMPKSAAQKAEWKKNHDWKVVEFWEEPMKAGPLVYASCAQCHQAHPSVPGMEIVKKGETLAFENGCVGCHQIHGFGNTISTDLTNETSVKPLTRIDFGPAIAAGLITPNERTLENWIRLHFTTAPSVLSPGDPEGHLSPDPKNPEPVTPSGMPYFGFNAEEAEALVAYVTSLKREKIPYTYVVQAPKEREPYFADATSRGRYVFQKYGCVSCHGKNADHGIPIFNYANEHAPDLVKVINTYNREELIKRIKNGVNPLDKANEAGPTPPLYMPAFKDRIQDQEMEDLVTYLFSIAEKTEDDW